MSIEDDAAEIAIGLRTLNNFTPFVPIDEPQVDTIECDWRTWLGSVGPKTFTREFSPFQIDYWNWYWKVTQKRRARIPLNDDELVFMAIWGRGLAKSSNVEWSAIGEGALIGSGYVAYVSGTQEQAEEHVSEIQKRLESEEVAKYYPLLSKPKISEHGNQYGWRQNFLLTEGGWAIRPIGLKTGIRGGRVGDMRLSMVIFDDIDEVDDSMMVIERKIARIAGSILPAGTPDTLKLIAQNLIHKNSVVNQIYTRKIDVLAERQVSGPVQSFQNLKIEVRQTPNGPRNKIVSGNPSWDHLDLKACQRFLNDSGRERFLAEYQHDFSALDQKRVIDQYDETIHVITWSQFEKIFGCRYIPKLWHRAVGHDIGYTKEHLSSFTFIATSSMNSALPNLKFLYRGLNFCEPLLDDMAQAFIDVLKPDASVGRLFNERDLISQWKMSHEKKGERMTYQAKFQLPFSTCDFGKSDGIAQWQHYLRPDHTLHHPFIEDEFIEAEITIDGVKKDALWVFGRPALYYIVDDDQRTVAFNDAGLFIHRQQVSNWEYRRSVETDTGLSVEQPVKAREDSCDSTRMITAGWGPGAADLTDEEEREIVLPVHAKLETIAKVEDNDTRSQLLLARRAAVQKYEEEKKRKDYGNWHKI